MPPERPLPSLLLTSYRLKHMKYRQDMGHAGRRQASRRAAHDGSRRKPALQAPASGQYADMLMSRFDRAHNNDFRRFQMLAYLNKNAGLWRYIELKYFRSHSTTGVSARCIPLLRPRSFPRFIYI